MGQVQGGMSRVLLRTFAGPMGEGCRSWATPQAR